MFLAAPLRATRVEVKVEVGARGNTGVGTAGGVQPIQLAVPVLQPSVSMLAGGPTMRADGRTLAVAPAVTLVPGREFAAADAPRGLPAPLPPSALIAPADATRLPATPALDVAEGVAAPAPDAAAPTDGPQGAAALDGGAHAGSIRFDGANARAAGDTGGWFAALKRALPFGRDIVPAWPGRAGETVRLGGRTFSLDTLVSQSDASSTWGVPFGRDYFVTIRRPGSADTDLAQLQSARGSDIPHAKLVASSEDGSVVVRQRLEGDTAERLLERGPWAIHHKDAWVDFAQKLIRAGVTADLSPANLQYAHYESRWILLGLRGLRAASPRDVLASLLDPALVRRSGLDATAALGALRGRFGPDSETWRRVVADIQGVPFLAAALVSLEDTESARPTPPQLVFGRGPARTGALDDSVVKAGDVVKRLGFDPWRSKHLSRFVHDKHRLGTELFSVKEPGKPALFLKRTDWHSIRIELAMRRLTNRFFGKWFDVAHAVAVEAGHDSYLVMEKVEGSMAYGRPRLNLEQRMALGVLGNAFGVYDLNEGGVFYNVPGRKDRPTLIDFVQSFGERGPVPGRMPAESMLQEMPWVSGHERNHASDYQAAARAWRAKFAEPATRQAIRADLLASGFSTSEADGVLAVVAANTARLDATFQSDVEFANRFVDKRETP